MSFTGEHGLRRFRRVLGTPLSRGSQRLESCLRRAGMSAFAPLTPLRLDTPPVLETSQDFGRDGQTSRRGYSCKYSEIATRSLSIPREQKPRPKKLIVSCEKPRLSRYGCFASNPLRSKPSGAFADGSIDIVEFKELKNPLVPKKIELEQQIAVLEKSKGNRLEPLRNWILEANQAEKVVSKDNWLEMKSLLQKVGSNRLLRAQTLTVSFKKPFDSLAETTLAVRSTTDVFSQSSKWWSLGGSNS